MKKLWHTHKYICRRIKPWVVDPRVSPLYAMGELAWDVAQRPLWGKYFLNKKGKAMMLGQYKHKEDRPDYFLVLPAPERKRMIEYLDVQSLCRMDQVMQNVYSLMAWYEALRGTYIASLSQWPRYTDKDKFAGLRWSMNRRVELRDVKIWKVVVNGRENTEEDDILRALCKDRKAKDVTCMLVNTGSIDPNYTFEIKGMSSPLLQLTCAAGNVDFVRALLQAGADVDKTTNIDGTTALIVASQMGHALVVEALIQAGADVDKVDINGHTALSHASNSGYTSIVEALLQAGADIDKAANDGATALIFASSYDHAAAMEALLQAGADIDKADNDGTTALIWASKYGRAAIVEALIQAGADVDKTANDGYTALMVASVNGHTAIVEALLQASADVDNASNSGATALIVASGNGHAATVKALIQAGADVNKATEGTTAVTRALSRGHTAIVKLLLGAGATW
tara:strand:+ start:173 stop:1543 length:1371 start_codon:yes stop_codon:yes gene_type:complete